MTERTENILAFGFLIILLCAVGFALNRCNQIPDAGGVIQRDTVIKWQVTQLPPTTDTLPVFITVTKRLPVARDTMYLVKSDTFFRDLPPFTLRGDEYITAKKDTIFAEYQFPANTFIYNCRYSPDSTKETTITIPPNRLQFGAQFGIGAAVGFDNIIRPAFFVGIGFNYRF